MTAYVLPRRYQSTANIAFGDSLWLQLTGEIYADIDVGAAALVGAGGDSIVLDSGLTDTFATRRGLKLAAGGNTVTVSATGSIRATTFGMDITGGANTINNAGTISVSDANGAAIAISSGSNVVTLAASSRLAGALGLSIESGGLNSISNSGTIVASTGFAIGIGGNANTIALYATSLLQSAGLGLEIDGGGNTINNAGAIFSTGERGIVLTGGGNTINNAGTIVSLKRGIDDSNVAGMPKQNAIVNTGLIRSQTDTAIRINTGVNLANYGTIDGEFGGVTLNTDATFSNLIVNYGTIIGRQDSAFNTGQGADTVINNGVIDSGPFSYSTMGTGNDIFDGRNGVQDEIHGEDGNDLLMGGAGHDALEGDADNDVLIGGGGADDLIGAAGFDFASYALGGPVTASFTNPAANTGDAAGDRYFDVEGLIGSQAGDLLVGSSNADTIVGLDGMDGIAGLDGNDTLYGGDGMDSIAGGNGNDQIVGGTGGDLLSGGAGADLFTYTSTGDGGDLIQDFNAGGVRDGFDLRALFDGTGYAGNDPRSAGLMSVVQNGADTDVYVYGAFLFRIPNLYAPALNDTYFLFQ